MYTKKLVKVATFFIWVYPSVLSQSPGESSNKLTSFNLKANRCFWIPDNEAPLVVYAVCGVGEGEEGVDAAGLLAAEVDRAGEQGGRPARLVDRLLVNSGTRLTLVNVLWLLLIEIKTIIIDSNIGTHTRKCSVPPTGNKYH